MKIAVNQPNYLPWLGFFELLDTVDKWVSLDDVQVVKRSFIVRNKICSPDDQEKWLTVNLEKAPRETNINEATLSTDGEWWLDHWNRIEAFYRTAPYFDDYADIVREMIIPKEKTLAAYNTRIISEMCEILNIEVEIFFASKFGIAEGLSADDRILEICELLNATEYYNFKAGVEKGLYDPPKFDQRNIKLFKQDYKHPGYNQIASPFNAYLSVIDLLFNEGRRSLDIIRSGRNWVKVGSI